MLMTATTLLKDGKANNTRMIATMNIISNKIIGTRCSMMGRLLHLVQLESLCHGLVSTYVGAILAVPNVHVFIFLYFVYDLIVNK